MSEPKPIQRWELALHSIRAGGAVYSGVSPQTDGRFVTHDDHAQSLANLNACLAFERATIAALGTELHQRDGEIARLREIERRAKSFIGRIIASGIEFEMSETEFDALVEVLAPVKNEETT